MSQYKILPSQVLIVPGYTNEEIIAMSAKTQDTTASALKNGTSSEDKTKAKKKNTKETTSSSDKTSLKSSQTKSRMLKASRGKTEKTQNEYLIAYKQKYLKQTGNSNISFLAKNEYFHPSWNPNTWVVLKKKTSNTGKRAATLESGATKAAAQAYQKANRKTTTNTAKDKKQSATKSTGKTKVTKKTAKASKKEKKTSKKTASNKNNKKKNSKVNESSAATATESQVKIEKPKALLFSPNTVDYTAHRPDYEEFNSADGLILIEKACDQYAELQLTLSVHQAMRIQENGTLELSADDKRSIDIITEGAPLTLDEETQLGHFLDPKDFTDSFVEIRRSFFDNYKNRPLTIISDLFPVISVCYITDLTYNINEGEEHAEYNITFREVANTWG